MSGKTRRKGLGIKFFESKNSERLQIDASLPSPSRLPPLPPRSASRQTAAGGGEVNASLMLMNDFFRTADPLSPPSLRAIDPISPPSLRATDPTSSPTLRTTGRLSSPSLRSSGAFLQLQPRTYVPSIESLPAVAPRRNPSNTAAPPLTGRTSDSSSNYGTPHLSQSNSVAGSPSLPGPNSVESSVAGTPPLPPRKCSANFAFTPSLASRPSSKSLASITPLFSKKRSGPSSIHTPAHTQKTSDASSTSLIPRNSYRDSDVDPLELIEALLSSNLREQAETFVRKSSLSTPVSLKTAPKYRADTATALASPLPHRNQRPAQSSTGGNSAGRPQRSFTYSGPNTLGIKHSDSGPNVCGTSDSHYRSLSTGFSPKSTKVNHSPHSFDLGNRILKQLPRDPSIGKRRVPSAVFPYFTAQQEAATKRKVYSKKHSCERHENCTDCTNIEFAYWENQIMSTSIPADERQKIIANNKSLRTIKNELDSLLDNGMISEDVYATITDALPSETSLNATARRNAAPSTPTPDANPLSAAISNMRLNSSNEPPAYHASTNEPPALPGRTPNQPERPVIGRATALYPYEGAPEDCAFQVGQSLDIYEYMNNEWCYGKNTNTGRQGLFPTNYVQLQPQPTPNPNAYGAYGSNEKQNAYGGYPGQYQQPQGPPPPGPSNPYNSAVPPMQIAEQPVESKPGKGAEMGKKFGKKLGNAAIFGAGATIGGNIVNSIF